MTQDQATELFRKRCMKDEQLLWLGLSQSSQMSAAAKRIVTVTTICAAAALLWAVAYRYEPLPQQTGLGTFVALLLVGVALVDFGKSQPATVYYGITSRRVMRRSSKPDYDEASFADFEPRFQRGPRDTGRIGFLNGQWPLLPELVLLDGAAAAFELLSEAVSRFGGDPRTKGRASSPMQAVESRLAEGEEIVWKARPTTTTPLHALAAGVPHLAVISSALIATLRHPTLLGIAQVLVFVPLLGIVVALGELARSAVRSRHSLFVLTDRRALAVRVGKGRVLKFVETEIAKVLVASPDGKESVRFGVLTPPEILWRPLKNPSEIASKIRDRSKGLGSANDAQRVTGEIERADIREPNARSVATF